MWRELFDFLKSSDCILGSGDAAAGYTVKRAKGTPWPSTETREMVLALVTDILLDSSAGTNVENIPCDLRKCKAKKRNFIHCWGDDQWMRTGDNTPIPMPMKRMSMAAASCNGQFMKRKHSHEFDSACLHGILRNDCINRRVNAPYARRCGDE